MSRLPVGLMSTPALTARWVELYRTRRLIDSELTRISAALVARQPREGGCGTDAGYHAHRRAGTDPDPACLRAHAGAVAAARRARSSAPTRKQGAER